MPQLLFKPAFTFLSLRFTFYFSFCDSLLSTRLFFSTLAKVKLEKHLHRHCGVNVKASLHVSYIPHLTPANLFIYYLWSMLHRESECWGKHCYMNAHIKTQAEDTQRGVELCFLCTEEGVQLGVGGYKIGGGCRINHRPGVNPRSYWLGR